MYCRSAIIGPTVECPLSIDHGPEKPNIFILATVPYSKNDYRIQLLEQGDCDTECYVIIKTAQTVIPG